MHNELTIVQSIYRAMVDPTYALNVFDKIPGTDRVFGEYVDVARAVRDHYRNYDSPLSQETLTTDVVDAVKRTNKATQEDIDKAVGKVTYIARLSGKSNYSNDKALSDKVDKWSRNQLALDVLNREVASNKDLGDPSSLERIVDGLNKALTTGDVQQIGDTVSLFDQDDTEQVFDLMSTVKQDTTPLHWNKLDALMGGGLAKGEMGLVLAESGKGKAQPLTTRIPTPEGIKHLGDLRVGDLVYNRRGIPVMVKAIYPQGAKKLFRVTTADGRVTYANDEHLFSYFVKDYHKRGRDEKLVTKTLADMIKSGVKTPNHGHIYQIPIAPAIEYPSKNYAVQPYTIGALIVDGSLTSSRMYMSASQEKLQILNRMLTENNWDHYKRNSLKNYTYTFYNADGTLVKTKEFPKELHDYAYNKHIPEEYKQGSISQREALIQGLFDTNGSVWQREGTNSIEVSFSTTSPQLSIDVMDVLRSLGLKAQRTIRDRTNNEAHKHCDYVINVAGKISQLKRLFSTDDRLRHFAGATEKRNNQDRTAIVKIEDMHAQVEMECIYVDDPEHLYVTDDYIVTHNTQALVNIASQYAIKEKQNVLYIALEERIQRLVLRAYRVISRQGMADLYDSLGNPKKDVLKKQLGAFSKLREQGLIGDFDIFASKPQMVSPSTVEQILQQYLLKHGHYPDVMIIDYPDLMDNPYLKQSVNEFRAAGMLYESIRRIAGQYKMIVWVASQMNRMAGQQETVNAYAIEGSKQKLNTVELCMSLNQTPEEFKAGFMRFYVDKVRNPGEGDQDRMINMKVDVASVTYRDETPEEASAHKEILAAKAGKGQFDDYKKPKMSAEQARKRQEEANQIIKNSLG